MSLTSTAEGVQKYFKMCKRYWTDRGASDGIATSKAFWWDCVEVWNADNSWNDAKIAFALAFRGYHVGDPIPAEEKVEKGEV